MQSTTDTRRHSKFTAALPVVLFYVVLSVIFFAGCGGDEEEKIINPKTTVIGAQGGMALSEDANVSIEVPAGALSSDTSITIGEVSTSPSGTVGKAYKFAPDGLQFKSPVTIKIKYDSTSIPAGSNETDLALGRESGDHWEQVANYSVDAINHTVSGTTTGFSVYGIYWPMAPTTSAECWNLVNQQVCKVLDATREINTGMLMTLRGYEKDFTQATDPNEDDYSSQELNYVQGGLEMTAEKLIALQDEIQVLGELEAMASEGQRAPGLVGSSISSYIFDYMSDKLGNFAKKYRGLTQELETKLLVYIGMCIEDLDRAPSYCRKVCTLNENFDMCFGEKFFDPPEGDDNNICEADKAELRAKAFNIVDRYFYDEKEWPKVLKLSRYIASTPETLDWAIDVEAFAANKAVELTQAGGELYWDTVKQVVTQGEYDDAFDAFEVVSNAFDQNQAPGHFPRTARAPMISQLNVQPADAIVLLVPTDMNALPIQMMAVVAENGVMKVEGVRGGAYHLFCYSKGNYPVVIDNVTVSPDSQRVNLPDPQPLENISLPLFTATTTGDPKANLNPSPVPPCRTCGGGTYLVTYKASRRSDNPLVTIDCTAKAKFSFEPDEHWKAVVEVPFQVQKSYFNKKQEDGSIFIYTPSSFSLSGTCIWEISKEVKDKQVCFILDSSSIGQEETSTFVDSIRSPEGVVVVLNDAAEVTTWGGIGVPMPENGEKLGCGIPIEYKYHDRQASPDGSTETVSDITITIKRVD